MWEGIDVNPLLNPSTSSEAPAAKCPLAVYEEAASEAPPRVS